MAFSVPDLGYSFDALEPYIDAQTMEIHHDKHHAAYVANANAALEGTEWADKSVEEILTNLSALPADKVARVRNNAGGHYNHSLFWESMGPDKGGEPAARSAKRSPPPSVRSPTSRRRLKAAGIGRFGSGWAWLDPRRLRLGDRLDAEPGQPDQSTARPRCSAWTSGSTRTTSSTRIAAPTTSTRWWGTVNWDTVAKRRRALACSLALLRLDGARGPPTRPQCLDSDVMLGSGYRRSTTTPRISATRPSSTGSSPDSSSTSCATASVTMYHTEVEPAYGGQGLAASSPRSHWPTSESAASSWCRSVRSSQTMSAATPTSTWRSWFRRCARRCARSDSGDPAIGALRTKAINSINSVDMVVVFAA